MVEKHGCKLVQAGFTDVMETAQVRMMVLNPSQKPWKVMKLKLIFKPVSVGSLKLY